MIFLRTILFFLFVYSLGFFTLNLLGERKKFFSGFNFFVGFGLGAFLVTMQLFIYLFIFKFSFSSIWVIFFLFELVTLIFINYRKKTLTGIFELNFQPKLNLKEGLVLLLVFIQIFFIFSNAFSRPSITYSSISLSLYRAKVLYFNDKVSFDLTDAQYLGGGDSLSEPWFSSLLYYFFYIFVDEYNDLFSNIINVTLFLGILMFLYSFIRKKAERLTALVFVFLFSSMPLAFYHSYNNYSDLTLSFFVLLSFYFLFEWFQTERVKFLYFSAIFLSSALWVKDAALIYIVSSLLSLFVFKFFQNKIKIKTIIKFLVIIFVLLLPWFLFKVVHNLGFGLENLRLGFHPEVVSSLIGSMFVSMSWNIWWYIVLTVLIFGIKKILNDRDQYFVWLLFFTASLCWLFLFLFTEEYRSVLNYTAVNRNILTLIPLSIVSVAFLFNNKFKN